MQAQTVILINCGGEVDLYEDLNLGELETRVIVADSHRCATPSQAGPFIGRAMSHTMTPE